MACIVGLAGRGPCRVGRGHPRTGHMPLKAPVRTHCTYSAAVVHLRACLSRQQAIDGTERSFSSAPLLVKAVDRP